MSVATDFLSLVLRGRSTLVAIHPDTGAITGLAVDRDSLAAADTWLTLHREQNCYWSPNTVKGRLNKKPTKADIARLHYVHLDLDDPSDAALERLRGYRLPPTFIVFSGGGYQAFWEISDPPVVNGNAEALEVANRRVLADLGGDTGTHNLDRIMRLPGTKNWPNAKKRARGRFPADAYLVEHHPERKYALVDFGEAPIPATSVLTPAPVLGQRDESESARLYRAVFAVIGADPAVTDGDVIVSFLGHPHVAKMKIDSEKRRAIQRCIDKARKALAKLLADMNAKHAVINWRGRTLIMTERRDPIFKRPTFELSSPADLGIWYANEFHIGKRSRATWWLHHAQRRQYDGIAFAPRREVPGYYNLWRGLAVEPRPGDCSLFKAMILDLICDGDPEHYKWVTAFCADAVRNPDDRPGVTLVLRGKPGTGKGTFARTLGRLFGDHYLHIRHSRHLVGNFNAHLANVLLLFADEAFYAGDRQGEGALKALITEPELPIEFKGRDLIVVQNHVRVVMASNQDWVVPASLDDRRFAIFDVSDRHAQDTAYFGAILRELNNGGCEAWLHELMQFDLSSVNLRQIPATKARLDQQIYSASAIQRWWYARLCAGAQLSTGEAWLDAVPAGEVFADYAHEAGIAGHRFRGTQTEFGIGLKKLVPEITKRKLRVVKEKASGSRPEVKHDVYVYTFPALEVCREAFARLLGRSDLSWPSAAETGAADRREKRDDL